MSLICICITDIKDRLEKRLCQHLICNIADKYARGVRFFIEWCEPIIDERREDGLLISLSDSSSCDNCEKLLLPDGWYINDFTNEEKFTLRMVFLEEIVKLLLERKHSVEFYIGLSGTHPNEYTDVVVKTDDFVKCLYDNICIGNPEEGFHIEVIA